MDVNILPDRTQLGRAGATLAAEVIRRSLVAKPRVRVMFAAAPSQSETLAELVTQDGIEWNRVEAFHMDEYLGLAPDHPAGFANWLDDHLFSRVPFGQVHRIIPGTNPDAAIAQYAGFLNESVLDLVLCGIGETGHIAFNDPQVADFHDPLTLKIVKLEQRSRQQQVDEGCFRFIDDVPTRAVTVTIPPLMGATTIICVVPGAHKRAAVTAALTGPVTPACPASILTTHPDVHFYFDQEAGADVKPR